MIFGLVEYSPATKCHLTQMSSVLYRKTFFFLRNLYDAVDRGSNMKIVRPRGGEGVDLCSYDEAAGSPESEIYRLL